VHCVSKCSETGVEEKSWRDRERLAPVIELIWAYTQLYRGRSAIDHSLTHTQEALTMQVTSRSTWLNRTLDYSRFERRRHGPYTVCTSLLTGASVVSTVGKAVYSHANWPLRLSISDETSDVTRGSASNHLVYLSLYQATCSRPTVNDNWWYRRHSSKMHEKCRRKWSVDHWNKSAVYIVTWQPDFSPVIR